MCLLPHPCRTARPTTKYPMPKLNHESERVERYTLKRLEHLQRLVPLLCADPRDPRGRRHDFAEMVVLLVVAVLSGCKSIRDAERLSQALGAGRYGDGISDGALRHILKLLSPEALEPVLAVLVKRAARRKELRPVGLRQHWVAIDGKYVTLKHHAAGTARRIEHQGGVYWRLGFLRAALVSCAGRFALGQLVMDPARAEVSSAWSFAQKLRSMYGDLCTNFTVDAGVWSKALFRDFDQADLGLFAGLKDNKPELLREASRVLRTERRTRAAAAQEVERYRGKTITRRLWRTDKLNGYDGWTNLRQVVLVEQTTYGSDGSPPSVEHRYFVTNVPRGHLTAREALLLVRRHWSIENDLNWTFDVQFGEDDGRWCTANHAVAVLGIIRMIALNVLQALRKRHVRRPRRQPHRTPARTQTTPLPWRTLFEIVRDVLVCHAAARPPPGTTIALE